jgi:hypothetical protein
MAQAPFIPQEAVDGWNTMQGQWTKTEPISASAWNLYNVVTDDDDFIGLDNGAGGTYTEDPMYRGGWAAESSFDVSTGRNDYLAGTMDLDGGGIPDHFDLALVSAMRFGTAGDGGALLFPGFNTEYDYNNDQVIGDEGNWTGWTSQRIWYAGLQTLSADWITVYDSDASFFGQANGISLTIVGGTLDGSPDGDIDGDGLTNLQEYQANTGDPWAFALAAITAAVAAPDVVLFKGFDGDDEVGDPKDNFVLGGSHAIVADSPFGGGTNSLEFTSAGGGTNGQAVYVGQSNAVHDMSPYSYLNFYVKAPAGSSAWSIALRERSGTLNFGDPPRREAMLGTWDSFDGFVGDQWSYISVPLSSLALLGDATNNPVVSSDSSLFTDLWMYNNNVGGALVWNIDHITFSKTSEGGRLPDAPAQDVVEALVGTIGGSITLTIPVGTPTGITWTFNGDAIPGETGASLTLNDLMTEDEGQYVANFDDGAKIANTYTVNLTVQEGPTGLPVASLFGLVTLAVGLAAGGTAAMRRRK